jgi:hypothetical protein
MAISAFKNLNSICGIEYQIYNSNEVVLKNCPSQTDQNLTVALKPKFSTIKTSYNFTLYGVAEGGANASIDL